MLSLIDALRTSANRLVATQTSLTGLLDLISSGRGRSRRNRRPNGPTSLEALEPRLLLTTSAVVDGDWFDASTWDNGVPDESTRAIISHGVTVELDGADHVAQELVIQGDLVVPEENGDPTEVEDGRLKLYVNGSLVGDAPGSQLWKHNNGTGIGGVHNNTMTHRGIVRGYNARDFDYQGQIDKVATHNRALSSSEIDSLFSATPDQATGVPQDNIASLWNFQQGSAAGLDEAVGDNKADNGVFVGDATTDGALTLDGQGDYFKVGNSSDLSIGDFPQKTISMWFKVDNTDGVQMIYEQGGHIRGLNVYLDGDTLYAGGWNRPGSESGWKGNWITQDGIVAGEWNHVALTLDANDVSEADKSLTTRWIHVNSGGELRVGSEDDRYDDGTFTLNLTGTDVYSDHVIETNMGGMMPSTMNVADNDGFLMTAMGGRVQFYGEDKLSFTKLSATAEAGSTTITVENLIERNYDKGAMNGDNFVTSAADDGVVNWEVGDQIVIASSSYDYTEEDVRTITAIVDNGDGTSSLTLNETLDYRHYGEIETYGQTAAAGTTAASQTYDLDLRAEVALLSRNIKIQGLASQDTDAEFGDRANVDVETGLNIEARIRSTGLSPFEAVTPTQVSIGVGAHIMVMPSSGQIMVDGVQLDRMGQTSQKGRYPIHWHLGDDRTGDVLKNTSITNSNNRGVTIHGTSNLRVEGVVLHDVHGHGFFFEDAVETGNELVANIAFGIHKVGGNDKDFANPGGKDPFVVDTHDNVTESGSRFKSSAAFWITNPTNAFVGNISAGSEGTGFWYAIPRTALGVSGTKDLYQDVKPIFAEFGQFDNNASHSTPVGLNFDRGSDIEDGRMDNDPITTGSKDNYSPRAGGNESGSATTNYVNGFTNYKATDAGVYHRGRRDTVLFNDLRIADSYNAAWAVFETDYNNSLFVGHSQGNADYDAEVGGPRLYDGAGLYTSTHFAGFSDVDAYVFQVEGSSFGPTMYHAFQETSFEADGTYGHVAHAVSDFQGPRVEHDLGQPQHWIKGALDLDGTLTGGVGGGSGYSIVPNVDFLVEDGDVQPAGWDAWLTDDIYARVKLENNNSGEALFPGGSTQPLVRFTARDGDSIDVKGGQNTGNASWTQVAAKTDGDGFVEGTFTVEFLTNGLPANAFEINMRNQDGGLPALNPEIQAKVENARIVVKVVAAGNYDPNRGTEVFSEAELRSVTSDVAYFRDDIGNLYLNTGIEDATSRVLLTPGTTPLQTTFASRTVQYGTTIEAEEFDSGIDGIAYHDTDATNSLGTFRNDTGVDATPTSVGNIADDEWLEYTTDIVAAAYRVGVNVSSMAAGGQVRVLAANSNSSGFLTELGTVDVPDTGGEFSTVWLEDVVDLAPVAGSDSVIRLEFVGGGFAVDSVQFASPSQTAYVDRTITAASTTRIELEEFDLGGQGVAYFDTSASNQTNSGFRPDEDVEATNTLLTNQVFEGEWLEYTTDIEAGVFDVTLKKAWSAGDAGVKLWIGDSNSATEFTDLGTFVLGSNESLTLEDIDLTAWAGLDRVIRIEIIGNWMGIDYLDFAPTGE